MDTPYNEERENLAPDMVKQMSFKQKVNPQNYLNNKVLTGSRIVGGGLSNIKYSNLMLYDAVVDVGGNGDFTDIQSAIDAGKTRIFVRAGNYVISSNITINSSNVLIRGEDKENTILQVKADSTDLYLLYLGDSSSVSNIVIRDLKFDGSLNTTGNGNCGILMHEASDIKIINCNFNEINNYGISSTNTAKSSRILVEGCSFNDCKYGVILYGGTQDLENVWIINNYVKELPTTSYDYTFFFSADNVSGYKVKNIIVTGNIIDGQVYNLVIKYCIGGLVTNNHFKNYERSFTIVFLEDVEGILIANNHIYESGSNGILLRGDSKYNTIRGNYFHDNGQYTDNMFSDILLDSYTSGDPTYNVICENIIIAGLTTQTKYGIREDDYSGNTPDYNIISNNIVKDQQTATISTQGANTITDNNIS